MKKLILLILLLPLLVTAQNVRYISPTGNDTTGDGSIGNPWFTVTHASSSGRLSAGDTLFVRGGTYDYDSRQTIGVSGTSGNEIVIINYPGEEPVFDFWNKDRSSANPDIYLYGIFGIEKSHIKLIGLHIRRLWKINTDNGRAHGVAFHTSNHIHLERLVIDSIAGRGIMGYDMSGTNRVINVDVSWCADPQDDDPGNAGTGIRWPGLGNVTDTIIITGSRFWKCADQGIGGFHGITAILDNNWSFNNGLSHYGYTHGEGGGMKTGLNIGSINESMASLTIQNSLVVYNQAMGHNTNQTNTKPILNIYNNLFYGNGGWGIYVAPHGDTPDDERVIRYNNNISFNNGLTSDHQYDFVKAGAYINDFGHNSWSCPFSTHTNPSSSDPSCGGLINGYSYYWSPVEYHPNNPANPWANPNVIVDESQFLAVPDNAEHSFTLMTAPRKPDGSLPDLGDYWKLAPTSDFINAGIDVGLPYNGTAPDLGPFEYVASGDPDPDPDPDPPPTGDILLQWQDYTTFTPLFGAVQTATLLNAYNEQWDSITNNLDVLRQAVEAQFETTLTWDNSAITPLNFSMNGLAIRTAINANNTILFANMDAVYTAVVALHAVPAYDSTAVTLLTTPTQVQFVSAYNLNLGLLVVNTTELFTVLNSYYGY